MVSRRRSWRITVVNIFGTLGYASVLLQWGWTLLILCYPFLKSGVIKEALLPDKPTVRIENQLAPPSDLTPLIVIISLLVTASIIIATLITLFKLPKKVGQGGARITQSTAQVIVQKTQLAQNTSKKRQFALSYKIAICLKVFLTLLPVVLLLFAPPIYQLPRSVVYAIGNFCVICSAVYWIVQYSLARFLKVPLKSVW